MTHRALTVIAVSLAASEPGPTLRRLVTLTAPYPESSPEFTSARLVQDAIATAVIPPSAEPFRSSVVSPCVRRCVSLDAAIPWLYLHGVSTGQMRQAVAALVGEQAARTLSANVVSRLKRSRDEESRRATSSASQAWTARLAQ